GLPTAGAAGLDEEVQAAFFSCVEKADLPFVFFEAFDQPWKTALPVEPHWGLFRADGMPKAWAKGARRRGGSISSRCSRIDVVNNRSRRGATPGTPISGSRP